MQVRFGQTCLLTPRAHKYRALDEICESIILAYMEKCRAHIDDGRICPRNAKRVTGLCGTCHGITSKSKQCTQPISKYRPWRKYCGRRHKTLQEIANPEWQSDPQATRPSRRNVRRAAILAVTATVTITIGAVTVNAIIGGSPSSDDRLSVQVKVDLNEALHELATAGWFLSAQGRGNSGPSYRRD